MKLAICISGLLRQPLESFDLINSSFAEKLDSDVFIYSWNKNKEDKFLNNGRANSSHSKEELLSYAKNCFKDRLKSVCIEDYDKKSAEIKKDLNINDVRKPPYRFFPQCYKMYMVNELRKKYQQENKFIYDVIIFVRTELVYILPLQPEVIQKSIEGKVCFCAAADYGGLQTTLGSMNNENANKYTNMYIAYKEIYLKGKFKFFTEKNSIDTSPNSFNNCGCEPLYPNNTNQLNSEYLYGYYMKNIFDEYYRFPYSCGQTINCSGIYDEKSILFSNFQYYIDPKINYMCKIGIVPLQGINLKELENLLKTPTLKARNKFLSWFGDPQTNLTNKELLQMIKTKRGVEKYWEKTIRVSFSIPLRENLEYDLKVYYF